MGKKRLNVGLFVSEYRDIFANEVCVGAMYAAEEMDVNLFIFPGGYFNAPYMEVDRTKYEYQNNYIYNFASKENIDVLIVLLGTIANNVSDEIQQEFLSKFEGIPIITIAYKKSGFSNISFDNRGGFSEGIEYLIDTLKKKEIGIVCGPATNEDSMERLEAYREVLKKHQYPVEERKIVYGNFMDSSDEAVEQLLDQNPELDAIVFSNDYMAVSGYRVLEKRGLKAGEDIAVIGFDDIPAASLMEPPLTTTRADSSELGYRAVKEATTIKIGDEKDIRIDTSFIVRASCGAKKNREIESLEEKFQFNPDTDAPSVLSGQIKQLLFDGFASEEKILEIEKEYEAFISWLVANVKGKKVTEEVYQQLVEHFRVVNTKIVLCIHNITFLYEVSDYLIHMIVRTLPTPRDIAKAYTALAECYKDILITYEKKRLDLSRRRDVLNRVVMDMTRDLTNVDNTVEGYDTLLAKMHQLNFENSYICMYPQTIRCLKDGTWEKPRTLCVKAYQNGIISAVPDKKEEMVETKDLFRIPFLDDGKRKTLSIAMIFSNDEQYGLLLVTPDKENLVDIEPISYQVATTIKTIRLIRKREDLAKRLEESLRELTETNAFLDEVSKSDELTQIYNRRGFLATARRVMREPENLNKTAVVLYADMNNLKLINDKFGHEEGDYALKMIAKILKEALGAENIIGRFGGDEFAAFLFVENKNYEQMIRNDINSATVSLNDGNDKPYYVSMSVGISAFANTEDAELNDAMVRADVDLYLQKKHKRNKILK